MKLLYVCDLHFLAHRFGEAAMRLGKKTASSPAGSEMFWKAATVAKHITSGSRRLCFSMPMRRRRITHCLEGCMSIGKTKYMRVVSSQG
jgi:hypothetical protein